MNSLRKTEYFDYKILLTMIRATICKKNQQRVIIIPWSCSYIIDVKVAWQWHEDRMWWRQGAHICSPSKVQGGSQVGHSHHHHTQVHHHRHLGHHKLEHYNHHLGQPHDNCTKFSEPTEFRHMVVHHQIVCRESLLSSSSPRNPHIEQISLGLPLMFCKHLNRT